jgi:SOS response regulatory protein OraA/RecX
MPTVTAVRAKPRGRVAVELDGVPWRTFSLEVAARAGLSEGRVLDRPALRDLRRELRRSEALSAAARTLGTRDLSRRDLAERLGRSGVDPMTTREALETLVRTKLVDDRRFARSRAESMAGRGYGDAAIRHDLQGRGIAGDDVDASLEALEPELERAKRVVERRGHGPRTALYLARKGFGEEAVESGLDPRFANDP